MHFSLLARDAAAVLDALPLLQQAVPVLARRLDLDRAVMAGYSFCAHGTHAVAGARLDLCPMDRVMPVT